MMLYIGSNIPLPIILFNEEYPAFHTEKLNEDDAIMTKHFSGKNILYAGSSEGCGCGFQHALVENNGWLNVVDEENVGYQRNMQQLHEYVVSVVKMEGKVELYACWDGDFKDSPLSIETISSEELISSDFHFKEKGFYIIN